MELGESIDWTAVDGAVEYRVQLWDGTRLPATGPNGPTFTLRSPRAVAHVLRAPGQLGLGRAYVSGELAVDDMGEPLRRALELPLPKHEHELDPEQFVEREPTTLIAMALAWGGVIATSMAVQAAGRKSHEAAIEPAINSAKHTAGSFHSSFMDFLSVLSVV